MKSKLLENEDVLYFDLQPRPMACTLEYGMYPGVSSYGMEADPPRFLYMYT